MEKENSAADPKTTEAELNAPTPPNQVKDNGSNSVNQKVEPTSSEETVINNNPDKVAEPKVQNHDWNNGKPEVTKEAKPKLDTHKKDLGKTADELNDEDLRKNKGNKEDEPVLEASEEVNTGQNTG
jgi:hypothetical protein